jgi:hypothetical protein
MVKRCFVYKTSLADVLVGDRAQENNQKNTKNQPKIGEFLALKMVWTPLLCIFASMFDFFKHIIVQFV